MNKTIMAKGCVCSYKVNLWQLLYFEMSETVME